MAFGVICESLPTLHTKTDQAKYFAQVKLTIATFVHKHRSRIHNEEENFGDQPINHIWLVAAYSFYYFYDILEGVSSGRLGRV